MMDAKLRLTRFRPDGMTRESAMLAGGRLVVTITSKATQRHMTFRFRCTDKGENWATVPFDEATHVYIESFDGEKVATLLPRSGVVYIAEGTTEAARWSVQALLRYLAGDFSRMDEVAEVVGSDLCGRCGQPLTDPHSIERGFGPDCFGMVTLARAAPARRHAA